VKRSQSLPMMEKNKERKKSVRAEKGGPESSIGQKEIGKLTSNDGEERAERKGSEANLPTS